MIFVRNPELGRVKTRLAKSIGDQAALEIYNILCKHTAKIISEIDADKFVFYSEDIQENDIWAELDCQKQIQTKGDLGQRMQQAFSFAFSLDYKKVIIIGSDPATSYVLGCSDSLARSRIPSIASCPLSIRL